MAWVVSGLLVVVAIYGAYLGLGFGWGLYGLGSSGIFKFSRDRQDLRRFFRGAGASDWTLLEPGPKPQRQGPGPDKGYLRAI